MVRLPDSLVGKKIMDKDKSYSDKDGKRYDINQHGDKIPPQQSDMNCPISGFSTYETEDGHCVFCGLLTCSGNCFR